MCVGNFDAISETKRFRGSCPIGIYRKVPTACRLVTSSMTSRDYDVKLVTSQYSKSLHSETRIRIINYPCGRPFKHTLSFVEHCVENQLIRLRTLGEEAFGATALRQKIRHFSWRKQLQRAVQNRLARVGGLKLAGLDRISFDTTSTDNKSRFKLRSARANSPTGLSNFMLNLLASEQVRMANWLTSAMTAASTDDKLNSISSWSVNTTLLDVRRAPDMLRRHDNLYKYNMSTIRAPCNMIRARAVPVQIMTAPICVENT